ncbi:MAG: N-acetylmuramic acid 6-phosphate etherase, partial [Candidatus Latescibacteria bacterium]|nr:N-acetylmuramic acid 6-phosphate etherase [Candidatus Latescibacterota bacterium]
MPDSASPSLEAFDSRITEHRNPRSLSLDVLSTRQILELINDEDATVIPAVRREIPNIERAVDLIVAQLERGGRLFYVGAGTSGRLGMLDAAEIPPTYGADPSLVQGIIAGGHAALVRSQEGAEDREDDGAAVVKAYRMTPDDAVFGIAASGTTPFVRGALHAACEAGLPTILLSCTPPDESLRRWATCCITPITGPEVVTGSTRMKAGTATKLVLNMVTTAAMVRVGKVYENLMV